MQRSGGDGDEWCRLANLETLPAARRSAQFVAEGLLLAERDFNETAEKDGFRGKQ